jgi:hypothetical protein
MQKMTCDEVHDAAAGYALDIIEPDDRQAFVAHLDGCPTCRQDVVRMQQSADRLLDLEGGFSGDGWGQDPVRPARRRLRMVVALAAAALLVFGSTFGSELYPTETSNRTVTDTAPFVQGGKVVGRVDVLAGQPSQIALSVAGLDAKGKVTCEVVTPSGAVPVGTFQLFKGNGYWISPGTSDLSTVTAVQLIDSSGSLVASASFESAV